MGLTEIATAVARYMLVPSHKIAGGLHSISVADLNFPDAERCLTPVVLLGAPLRNEDEVSVFLENVTLGQRLMGRTTNTIMSQRTNTGLEQLRSQGPGREGS